MDVAANPTANETGLPPPPNGQVLSLVSALSQQENHDLHVQAMKARDEALSVSQDSYSHLCLQLGFLLVGCDNPMQMTQRIDASHMALWQQTDPTTVLRLQSQPEHFIAFGQMAGLILKNALLRPPIPTSGPPMSLDPTIATHMKETLLYGLSLSQTPLRNVVSTIIATSAVSPDGLQAHLHISAWPQLMPALTQFLQNSNSATSQYSIQGSLSTIHKMMEDGPNEIPSQHLDTVIPLLIAACRGQHPDETVKLSALQSLVACLTAGILPSALILQFSDYMEVLSTLATDSNGLVRIQVCRSINTLLQYHTQYLANQLPAICQFMLTATVLIPSSTTLDEFDHRNEMNQKERVCLEACEFWLLFASLPEDVLDASMMQAVQTLLPQLIPILLNNMVCSADQQRMLQDQNEMDGETNNHHFVQHEALKPVFHRSKAKGDGGGDVSDDDDAAVADGDSVYSTDIDLDLDIDDDDNEWTLRKCAGASLDCLASLYGGASILPALLPSLEGGLQNPDPWIQEASILALGAIADGCLEELSPRLGPIFPFLLNILRTPESPQHLPQVKSICAWTVSRFSTWVVEQVQSGAQGHLLAEITEVLLQRLQDRNRKVQVAVGSALGVIVEVAGDLMAPYLQHMYPAIVSAIARYKGKSRIILFDTMGVIADYCGPAIGENNLPQIYVPVLLQTLDSILSNDPSDRSVLPLMETIAGTIVVVGPNYQPYALETFEKAMAIIEQMQLMWTTWGGGTADEDADVMICATDLLDGLCEGMQGNFVALVSSSTRYGEHFLNVLHALCQFQVTGVRMSALALLGDLARHAPSLIAPALPQLIQEAIRNMEPTSSSAESTLCSNAVWASGEICIRCRENPAVLQPFAGPMMQQLIPLLVGNGAGRVSSIPGLAENAAACVGRLALANANFVAPELPRFLLGWCDGMARVTDPNERRDAFSGFFAAMYANPQAVAQAASETADAVSSIIFAITSWHVPHEASGDDARDLLSGMAHFHPFPQTESELGVQLKTLTRDLRSSVGESVWSEVQNYFPVNVRKLLRDEYQM